MKTFFIAVVVCAITILTLLNVHIIVHGGGVAVVMKERPAFDGTYVDARDTNPVSYLALPGPVRKYLAGKQIDTAKKAITEGMDKLKKTLE